MKLAIAQMATKTADFEGNLKTCADFCGKAKNENADLVLFPEMFLCGFNYAANIAFLKNGKYRIEEELSKIARENSIWLCGSNPHLENPQDKRPFNRMSLFAPDGQIKAAYDKAHLFGLFNEDRYICGGRNICVAQTPFGKIGLAICYDLRFPELFRTLALSGAELILFSACFPRPRDTHFDILSRARAIENQYWFAAANRAGSEVLAFNKLEYFGQSAILDPWGNYAARAAPDKPDLIFADIDPAKTAKVRSQIEVFSDRRTDLYGGLCL